MFRCGGIVTSHNEIFVFYRNFWTTNGTHILSTRCLPVCQYDCPLMCCLRSYICLTNWWICIEHRVNVVLVEPSLPSDKRWVVPERVTQIERFTPEAENGLLFFIRNIPSRTVYCIACLVNDVGSAHLTSYPRESQTYTENERKESRSLLGREMSFSDSLTKWLIWMIHSLWKIHLSAVEWLSLDCKAAWPITKVTDTYNGGRILGFSAHLLSRALLSQSASVTRYFFLRAICHHSCRLGCCAFSVTCPRQQISFSARCLSSRHSPSSVPVTIHQ
jgi:hypothetical protein